MSDDAPARRIAMRHQLFFNYKVTSTLTFFGGMNYFYNLHSLSLI